MDKQLWGHLRAGWERPNTQLIRPVAFLGDGFCVEKSWETSLCGAERAWRCRLAQGLGPTRPSLEVHLGCTWALGGQPWHMVEDRLQAWV